MHGARTRASNRWTPRGYNRPSWPFRRCSKSTVDPGTPIFPPGHSDALAAMYMSIPLQCYVMDPGCFGWLVPAVQRVPRVRCGLRDAHLSSRPFHFTPSNHGHATAVVPRYGTCPTMTCLGDPRRFTQYRPKAGSHNGDPSRFTQWRSKPVHTMEIQAASHNRGPKPAHILNNHTVDQDGWGDALE